ncbi:hypothetical protein P7C73_g1595, partial [Tremellales sp. Uapishka_1]
MTASTFPTEAEAAAALAPNGYFTAGCIYASIIIDTFLAGIFFMQVVSYVSYQPNDRWQTKAVVAWTAVLNIVTSIYNWIFTSNLFVTNFGLWAPWLEPHWLAVFPTLDVVTVSVIQGFFAYRAFLLSGRNWWLQAAIWPFIITAFGGGIGVTVVYGKLVSELEAAASGPCLYTWTAATSAADILITGSILFFLIRSKSGWASTDRLLPSITALAYLAEYVREPSSLLGATFQDIQPKCYAVGLMFAINARVTLRSSTDHSATNGPTGYSTKYKADAESLDEIDEQKVNPNNSQARLTSPEIV